MDIRSTISLNIPEALVTALGITDETPFVVNFKDGVLTIEPIVTETEELDDAIIHIESENDEWYEEGYSEGHYDGYMRGYQAGYSDSENGLEFDDNYIDDDAVDCDYDCDNCCYYDTLSNTCEALDEE